MFVVAVTVFVVPGAADAFQQETLKNARGTRQEPGNVRFDVLRAEEDENRFLLYEVYESRDAFLSHQKTPHYLSWREAVAPMMAQPRQGVKHRSIFFGDGEE